MNSKYEGHEDVHCDYHLLIGQVCLLLESIYANEKHAVDIEHDPVVNRAHTVSIRAEREEFLRGPLLVDAVGIFDFFLLDRIDVES